MRESYLVPICQQCEALLPPIVEVKTIYKFTQCEVCRMHRGCGLVRKDELTEALSTPSKPSTG